MTTSGKTLQDSTDRKIGNHSILSRRAFLKAAGLAGAGLTAGPAGAASAAAPPPHEARFYDKLKNNLVRCRLCPKGCVVPPGGAGYCRVRENRDGTYVTRVYGLPCAVHDDPIEKKPLFHVYPGSRALSIATVGCNMHCKFCQNWDISQASPDDVSPPYRAPETIAERAARQGCKTVAYTYNEPTVFCEYMLDCARAAREQGIGNVMISNGYIGREPLAAVCREMTAVKVDLKAFTQRFYREMCEGDLQPVLDILKSIKATGTWLEIVVLIIPTRNDSLDEIKRMAHWIVTELGPLVPIHFTRFHPCYKIVNLPPTPPSTLRDARDAALAEGCRFVYTGNMPGQAGEHTYCPGCNTPVVTRYGFLLLENRLRNGRCPQCNTEVPGIWA
ncbi:MAG: AmmeMemoRadiSam system radical SAM enzyme [Lentisphaerae bacterium]|nr:AmmeMemoRadiSam system radical SAM enzyme [Lentisphaerota bacterium]